MPTPARGEAARDRFYVAKQLARRLGAIGDDGARPRAICRPPARRWCIGSRRWSMFPGREAALQRWVEAGGHLVVLQSAWSAEGDTPRWVPMRSAHLRSDGTVARGLGGRRRRSPPSARARDRRPRRADRDAVALQRLRRARRDRSALRRSRAATRICGTPIRVLHADAPHLAASQRRGRRRRARRLRARRHHRQRDRGLVRQRRAAARRRRPRRSRRCCSCAEGDAVWFFDEETRARFLVAALGSRRAGAPARRRGDPAPPLAQRHPLRPAPRRPGAGAPLGRRAGASHRRLHRRRRRRGAASGERPRARGGSAPRDRRLRRPCSARATAPRRSPARRATMRRRWARR